jgi:hypothetical protein
MMVAHKLIDVLLGKVKNPPLVMPFPAPMKRRELCAEMIRKAAKFDFRTLAVEKLPARAPNNELVDVGGAWALPNLTPAEMGFFREGLIPLPYSACWYEFTLGGSRSGLLVYQSDVDGADTIYAERLDWNEQGVVFEGLIASVKLASIPDNDDDLEIYVEGNGRTLERMQNHARLSSILRANVASALPLALYFTLMLNSRTTESERAPKPDAALQKRRVQRGREPLPEHRIVTIVPDRFIERGEHLGGTHRPPRLHWRRSHKRHFEQSTPLSKWVPTENYRGRLGWWVSIIPRCLVGRADLGEVSHEYRIERSEEREGVAA